jgi:hypothetical protein
MALAAVEGRRCSVTAAIMVEVEGRGVEAHRAARKRSMWRRSDGLGGRGRGAIRRPDDCGGQRLAIVV